MKVIRLKSKIEATISMINLIDIIFVLLIFFMITTTFKHYTNFNIKLPQSSTKLDKSKDNLPEIFYQKDNTYVLKSGKNKEVLSLEELKTKVANLKEKKRIKLSADKEISYGKVIGLMVVLKDVNIENVELNIEKK